MGLHLHRPQRGKCVLRYHYIVLLMGISGCGCAGGIRVGRGCRLGGMQTGRGVVIRCPVYDVILCPEVLVVELVHLYPA